MKEPEQAGHVMFNADAWDFSDPVVITVTFTVIFCVCMLFVLFRWVRKNMAEDAKRHQQGEEQ
ncbi:MAG: hypothetical protein R8K53_01680 [Mariprofundaceae bacterium]